MAVKLYHGWLRYLFYNLVIISSWLIIYLFRSVSFWIPSTLSFPTWLDHFPKLVRIICFIPLNSLARGVAMVEKEKISFFKQIAYMLGLVWQACPAKLIVQSTVGLLQALQSFIFEILFIKFIIQILETNGKFTDIIIFSIAAIFLKLLVNL